MNKWTIAIGILVIAVIALIALILLPGKTNAPPRPPSSDTTATTTDSTASTTPSNPDVEGDVIVTTPAAGAKIASPVVITGTAKGSYYFEASFPIEILDASGKVIGQGHADAQSDWMTTEYVPFKATITFTSPGAGKTGTIRLKNDNPSGDPAKDKHFDVPVKF